MSDLRSNLLDRSIKRSKFKQFYDFGGDFGATSTQNDTSQLTPMPNESPGCMRPASRQCSFPRLIRHTRQNTTRVRRPPHQKHVLPTVGNDGGARNLVEESSPTSGRESHTRSSSHVREPRSNLEKRTRFHGPRRAEGGGVNGRIKDFRHIEMGAKLQDDVRGGDEERVRNGRGASRSNRGELVSQWRVSKRRR